MVIMNLQASYIDIKAYDTEVHGKRENQFVLGTT